jgi:SNF2 family DNA or RNA helicase
MVVFAHHGDVMDKLQEAFGEAGVGMIRIDGTTSVHKRHGILQEYKRDESSQIALLGIESCGVGLTITEASVAVFVELNWVRVGDE